MIDFLITILFAVVGGFLPAIIWLFFWLKEDSKHPEPKKLILKTFFYGMLGVPLAFLFQTIFNFLFLKNDYETTLTSSGFFAFLIVFVWAGIEEYLKYVSARNGGLRAKDNDEPIDFPIYMITAALGFAALENVLFLLSPLLEGDFGLAFLTGNLRFIGATLVHVASSAVIGILGALSYFFKNRLKKAYIISGFFLATILHGVFNLFIIRESEIAYIGFITIWILIVLLIILFEKIKHIHLNKIK